MWRKQFTNLKEKKKSRQNLIPFNLGLNHSYSTPEDTASSQAILCSTVFEFGCCSFATSLMKKQAWVATFLGGLLDCTNHLRKGTFSDKCLLNIPYKSSRITSFTVPYFQETDNQTDGKNILLGASFLWSVNNSKKSSRNRQERCWKIPYLILNLILTRTLLILESERLERSLFWTCQSRRLSLRPCDGIKVWQMHSES